MQLSSRTSRISLLTLAAIATALTLSACSGATTGTGSGESAGPSSTADASAADASTADIEFAQMMIPHHEQAVQMSEGMLAKANVDPRVTALATTIKAAQAPEITRMKAWLKAWGAPTDSMAEMDHGTDGMMSDADMMTLDNATGPDADRIYLTQMVAHHKGAIAMAKTELADGKDADALALAEAIVASQTEEIAVMTDLLATL
ncbi:DUF305 domain-containing protein [Cryobacterium fucosi]|uniref:DUF305 domain-containing protein n=2 Tax=Cryobacterium fucosi TaxID=1259157 RepID=A0A4R9B962_9MICO|nr:DUF305 domain-containing protein [Cryobacterium fucosi]